MSLFFAIIAILSPLVVALITLHFWAPKQRAKMGEPPVKEYMLRPPGESSRRVIAVLNEKISEDLLLITLIPIALSVSYFHHQSQHVGNPLAGVVTMTLICLVAMFWKGRVLWRRLKELRNRELGCAGEQLVAERLAPVAQHGCLIFHDCPADMHGNIDHIVVTSSVVYAIETKTRRKRPSPDPERATCEVIYDGHCLDFPHGREDFALDQTRRQALWLADLLKKALAEPVEVRGVLALPGWMVRRKGRGDVAVVNPKELPALIRDKSAVPSPADAARRMQQIAFVLDGRCRDVAFGTNPVTTEAETLPQSKKVRVTRPRYSLSAGR